MQAQKKGRPIPVEAWEKMEHDLWGLGGLWKNLEGVNIS